MRQIAIGAALGAFIAVSPAAAETVADVRGAYNAEAFSDADDDWRRVTANRHGYCGEIGRSDTRRLDILVDQYLELGAALNAGNDDTAMAAARALSATIERNSRFGDCWSEISRRAGVSRSFTRTIAKV